jgi:hypothetical protein
LRERTSGKNLLKRTSGNGVGRKQRVGNNWRKRMSGKAVISCTNAYIYVSHTSSGSSTVSLIHHRLVVQ